MSTEMPDEIWITPKWHEGGGQSGLWTTTDKSKSDWADYYTRYIRADIHAKEVEKLKVRVTEVEALWHDAQRRMLDAMQETEYTESEYLCKIDRLKRETVRVDVLLRWIGMVQDAASRKTDDAVDCCIYKAGAMSNLMRMLRARLPRTKPLSERGKG